MRAFFEVLRGLLARLPLWLVLGLVVAAYSGVPHAGFVWDDHALVEYNRVLSEPTLRDVWLRDLWCCTVSNNTGYYRPLLTLSLLLDHAIAGFEPALYHVQSLAWHLLVVALVSVVLRPRVGPVRANAAALIFGLHPIQSEAVVWISARNDLLAAAGVLGTLAALDRRRRGLAAIVAFAACISKENAFLLPAVAPMWRLAWGDRDRRDYLADLAALAVGVGGAYALRSQAELGGFSLHQSEFAFNARSALHGLVTVIGWPAWPWPLTTTASLYMPAPQATAWPAAVATLLVIGALLVRGRARALWLLAIGALLLAPSALGVRWYATLGERYLYLPIFGLVAALVATVPERPKRSPALAVALAAWSVAALGLLHVRVPDWANEESLFTAAVRRAPDGYAWDLLAVELGRQERWPEATAAFDRALLATPVEKRACRHVINAAQHVLTDADLLARSKVWSDRGCKGHDGYDGARALALAARGYWADAEAVARDAIRNDRARRDQVVLEAVEIRDGDLASAAARALAWPSGAADLVDQAAFLTMAASAPADVAAPVARDAPAQ